MNNPPKSYGIFAQVSWPNIGLAAAGLAGPVPMALKTDSAKTGLVATCTELPEGGGTKWREKTNIRESLRMRLPQRPQIIQNCVVEADQPAFHACSRPSTIAHLFQTLVAGYQQ